MPITLTVPEAYPDSLEARLISLGANLENRTLTIVVQFGRTETGEWRPFREIRLDFSAESTPSFIQVVNAVPEFRDLRRALETWLTTAGILSGTVS